MADPFSASTLRCSRFMSSHILTPTVHCTPTLTPSLPVTYSATLNSYCTPIRLLDMNTFTLKISPGRSHPQLGALDELSRIQNRPSISIAYSVPSAPIHTHPQPLGCWLIVTAPYARKKAGCPWFLHLSSITLPTRKPWANTSARSVWIWGLSVKELASM